MLSFIKSNLTWLAPTVICIVGGIVFGILSLV